MPFQAEIFHPEAETIRPKMPFCPLDEQTHSVKINNFASPIFNTIQENPNVPNFRPTAMKGGKVALFWDPGVRLHIISPKSACFCLPLSQKAQKWTFLLQGVAIQAEKCHPQIMLFVCEKPCWDIHAQARVSFANFCLSIVQRQMFETDSETKSGTTKQQDQDKSQGQES